MQGNKTKTNTQHTNPPNGDEETGLQGPAFINPITNLKGWLSILLFSLAFYLNPYRTGSITKLTTTKGTPWVLVFKGRILEWKIFDLESWRGQNLPCTETELVKTSKEKLLEWTENDMQTRIKSRNFYKAFHEKFRH